MTPAPDTHRAETRIPVRMFVKLSLRGSNTFEISPTINISCHGARVETKTRWELGQHLSVRSIRGNLYSQARVAYCQRQPDSSYVVGLELQFPTGDWTKAI